MTSTTNPVVGEGSKFIGIVLLGVFGIFIFRTFSSIQRENNLGERRAVQVSSSAKQLGFFAIGMALVIISAKIIVDSASSIADHTGIRESVIGATIIALGTSLPELTVDLAAVRKRHLNLALGDIIGSSLTNIGLILGIVEFDTAVTVVPYFAAIALMLALYPHIGNHCQ